VLRALEDLAAGRVRRLMLLLPPGSAKSTYASVLFPAWWMARNPSGSVIAASHTAALAEHFGRGVRGLLNAHGARLNVFLRGDARAAGRFSTESGSEYFAVGIGGAVTGRRADLALIDDPIASFEQARSLSQRELLWNWFRSELVTRLKPGGRIALVMTRWHTDDLAGRLIEQGGWRVLRLPALAQADDALGRAEGEALWPEWESREELLVKRGILGERQFEALFQQAPLPEDGTIFDVRALGLVDVAPPGGVRGWDLAGGIDASRDPDWTVGVLICRDPGGGFVIDDVRRVRVAPSALGAMILDVARQDGPSVRISLPRDPGQAGLHQVAILTEMLAGFNVHSSAETGTKTERAMAVAGQVNVGNLRIRRAAWNREFVEELSTFPNGRKDDQVDALSRAFALLTPQEKPARFVSMRFFDR
jgi:predicted phage terminase large subunit-like protein